MKKAQRKIIKEAFKQARLSHPMIGAKYENAKEYIKDLEKEEANTECNHVRIDGAGCSLNNNCNFPKCIR